MDAMTKPRPPYLNRETTRHGKVVWYVRKGDGPRIRIAGAYGSAEFMANYQRAVSDGPASAPRKPSGGTFRWLLSLYRQSAEWARMAPATRYKHDKIFVHVVEAFGDEMLSEFTREAIIEGRERRAQTPHQARHFLDAMRGIFGWAVNAAKWDVDPTEGVKNPPKKKGKGFPVWTEADVAAYENHWPQGTQERVWLDVLLYTGARRGDAWRLGPQHVEDDMIVFKTEKSGEEIEVTLPILPVLAATLARGPTGETAFIVGKRGRPFERKESFGNAFSKAARAAGVPKSAHGMRKVAATRAADNGATEAELEAIFGWTGGKMASLYTRSADRKRLSKAAIHKLTKARKAPALRVINGGNGE